ncbi:sigma-70 family RNA polymerase sigma factor [Marinobacterium lutimaris]|nr:sigma-70 family RNA polymerase sigma factor [Marinobacterium lutimaris]
MPSTTLSSFYQQHHGWLWAWLRQRLECSDTAADLAQDTFVRLLTCSTPPRFFTVAQARGYLCTTAKHLCLNLWRRQEIERAWLETLSASPEELHPSAEHQAAVMEALEEISLMLQALHPNTAKAFLLAVVCQMTDDAVGTELGISGRMVRKHVAKAMLICLQLQARFTARELPLYAEH